jgi:hypothetical protein
MNLLRCQSLTTSDWAEGPWYFSAVRILLLKDVQDVVRRILVAPEKF